MTENDFYIPPTHDGGPRAIIVMDQVHRRSLKLIPKRGLCLATLTQCRDVEHCCRSCPHAKEPSVLKIGGPFANSTVTTDKGHGYSFVAPLYRRYIRR